MARLGVETLEQRCVPTVAIDNIGMVSGVAFFDTNVNGVRNTNEPAVIGAKVILTNDSSVYLTALTDSTGTFAFRSVPAGDYRLWATPNIPLLTGNSHELDFTLTTGEALNQQNLAFANSSLPRSLTAGVLIGLNKVNPQAHLIQVGPPANSPPVVSHTLGTVSLPENTSGDVVDLAGFFTDPDFTDSQVRLNLLVDGGPESLTVNLFDAQAPETVANFFDYVNSGAYDNAFFNSLTAGMLTAGAITVDSTGTNLTLNSTQPPVPNEFAASNVADTIAMAQSDGNINSATDQFFFNTADNHATLNAQKATVFGQLTSGSDAELAALASTSTANLTNATLTHNFPSVSFANVPLNNYNGSSATFPGDATLSNYEVITGVDVLRRDEILSYSATSSNPRLVTASISNEFLTLNAVAGKTGTATITVKATDLFGSSVTQKLTVHITAAPIIDSVSITPDQASPVGSLTANPTSTPASGVTYTYQWYQNGFALPDTNKTLNLSGLDIQAGDKFTVKVVASKKVGSVTTVGAAFLSDAVTIATASPITLT